MTKKPFRFDELSDVHCIKCGRPLKKNVIERKPTATLCYKCSQQTRKKHIK